MTSPQVTNEMVERFKTVYRAKVNEIFSRTDVPMKEEALTEAVREGLTAALSAMPGQVAEGWKLVPIKPTPEMIKAGYEMLPTDAEWGKDEIQAVDVWDEMLAASPTPPAQEG